MGACPFLHWSPPDDVIKICVLESIALQKKHWGCPLVLITDKKSHTGFWLTSMTLNDPSPNAIALLTNYVTVVEDTPIMSTKYCLPVPVFHLWPKLTHPAARSLCDRWSTCFKLLGSRQCVSFPRPRYSNSSFQAIKNNSQRCPITVTQQWMNMHRTMAEIKVCRLAYWETENFPVGSCSFRYLQHV